jgi:hypothetical protein
MTISTSAATLSRLDEWWRRRGYAGDPFVASKAEDASLRQLQDWYIDCPWPTYLPRRGIDTLAAVISEGDSRLALMCAPTGGGKTFYRRLAAQLCREEISSRGALEIDSKDINRARVSSREGLSSYRLAVCVREEIRKHHPQPPSLAEANSLDSADDSGYVLSQCAVLTTSFNSDRGRAKLYIFLDDLDKVYKNLRKDKRSAAIEAIADFLGSVAGGAGGEYLAMRVFLPMELCELIQQALDPDLRRSILLVKLSWTLKSCEEVAERRFETTWSGGPGPERGHLGSFLNPDALDAFRRMLKKRERRESLSPRDVIETLSSVANYAARQGVKDQPISEKMYRESQETRKARPWPRLLWDYSQVRAYLIAFLSLSARTVRSVIQWLASVLDRVEAFLLLVPDNQLPVWSTAGLAQMSSTSLAVRPSVSTGWPVMLGLAS